MSAFSSPTVHEPGGAYAVMPTEGALAGHAAQRGPRWYVANVREGDEASVARDCLKLVDRSLLADCFAPQALRLKKRDGEWRTEPRMLYPGRIFMVSCDPKALARELERLSFWVHLVGERGDGEGYTPLVAAEQALFEALLDGGALDRAQRGEHRRRQAARAQRPAQGPGAPSAQVRPPQAPCPGGGRRAGVQHGAAGLAGGPLEDLAAR